jgi:hypothetical protein
MVNHQSRATSPLDAAASRGNMTILYASTLRAFNHV